MRLSIVILGAFAFAAGAAGQTPSLQIETATGGSQFRIGETILLKATWEMSGASESLPAGPSGWETTLAGDRSVLGMMGDRFLVAPDTGTRDPWTYRNGSFTYSGPGPAHLGNKPMTFDMALNQWVRFERPGHYAIQAIPHVMGPSRQSVEIASNRIEIDIVADPVWQAKELADDVAVLESADSHASAARIAAARRIAYLDTPAAVREMARWMGKADSSFEWIIQDGLRSTQHPPEAIAAMRELLASPSEPISPDFLRTLEAMDKSGKDPRSVLAEVVEQKQGVAKATSMKTLLDNIPVEGVPVKMRSEIAATFTDLPLPQQRALLGHDWGKIESSDMLPVLRRIYETAPQSRNPDSLLISAVERLYEMDTARTRTLLIEEMKQPNLHLPYSTLAMLPDATLPELDAPLLDNLRQNQNGSHAAAELIARYATASIADPVKDLLAKRDAEILSRNPEVAAPGCAPPLIAYFLRVDPAWGEKILREVLAERSHRLNQCWRTILSQTAPYNSGPVWQKVAADALKDPEVPVKIDAVRSLAQYGSPDSKSAIFDAFRFWHEWWQNRGEQNEENRRLEQAFIEATARPKNWTPTDADLMLARDLCVSAPCKTRIPQRP